MQSINECYRRLEPSKDTGILEDCQRIRNARGFEGLRQENATMLRSTCFQRTPGNTPRHTFRTSRTMPGIALLALLASQPGAQAKTPDELQRVARAATDQDQSYQAGEESAKDSSGEMTDEEAKHAQLLKLARDGKEMFLYSVREVGKGVPRGATVVVNMPDTDPLFHDSLVRELASARRFLLLADVDGAVSGSEDTAQYVTAPPNEGDEDSAGVDPAGPVRGALLPTDNVLLLPDVAQDWPEPDMLFSIVRYANPHDTTAWSLSDSKLAEPERAICVAIRHINASDGTVTAQYLRCFQDDEDGGALETAVRGTLKSACNARPKAVVFPLKGADEGRSGADPFGPAGQQASYLRVLNTLNEMGCRIQDIPSQTPNAKRVAKQGNLVTGFPSWRYHPRLRAVVRPAVLKQWRDGDVAISISGTLRHLPAGELIDRLASEQDRALIDPDLQLLPPGDRVTYLHLGVEAVDVRTGDILLMGSVAAGKDTPRDLLAKAVANLLGGGDRQGWVEVHRVPPSGKLELDRKGIPATPGAQLVAMAPGRHRLDLKLGGKRVTRETVRVRRGTYSVVTLAVPFGWLHVEAFPEGAVVEVDGENWGEAPVGQSLGAGTHTVTARMPECGEVTASTQVLVGEEASMTLHLPGWVNAEVVPADASIYLDEKKIGQGHARVEAAYGRHTLAFRLEGFDTRTVTVDVESCQQSDVIQTFVGRLEVASVPGTARSQVDGKLLGNTPAGTYLLACEHKVRCDWCEYGSGDAIATLQPGRVTNLTVQLQVPRFSMDIMPEARIIPDGGSFIGIGLRAAGWYSGRFGLTGMAGLRKGDPWSTGGTSKTAWDAGVFASYRLLAPGAGWTIPLSGGVRFLNDNSGVRVLPGLRVDMRHCLSQGAVVDFGSTIGIPVDGGSFSFMLHAGVGWQTAVRW